MGIEPHLPKQTTAGPKKREETLHHHHSTKSGEREKERERERERESSHRADLRALRHKKSKIIIERE